MNDDRLINPLESGLGILLPSSIDRCFLPGSGKPCMIAREDKIHPIISGNKWRKLKYYLLDYLQSGKYGIATTGGAHSNLLHALAFACHTLKIPTTYFIQVIAPHLYLQWLKIAFHGDRHTKYAAQSAFGP
ncbi:MAG: hypothetical protein IPM86_06020 [Saprospiraceae bacterium]|nr:hypothetical protein [Saprospiraceae bacterium]